MQTTAGIILGTYCKEEDHCVATCPGFVALPLYAASCTLSKCDAILATIFVKLCIGRITSLPLIIGNRRPFETPHHKS